MLSHLLTPKDTEERCGLVLADGTTVELRNIAEDRVNSYVMDPIEVLPYLTADAVTGTWHTHPQGDPTLSGEDLTGFLSWPNLKHHVIGRRNGKVVVNTYEVKRGAVVQCA